MALPIHHIHRVLSSSRAQHLQSPGADEVAQFLTNLWVLSIGQVVTTSVEEASNSQARAIEFTQDILTHVVIDRHEVCGPQQGELRHFKVECLHDVWNGAFKHLPALLPLRGIRSKNGLLVISAHTLWIFVVLNPVQLSSNTHESSFSFVDAGKVSLVHHDATSFFAACKVLTLANGLPFARLSSTTVGAELDELVHSVFFHMIVVCLHEFQHFVPSSHSVTEFLAVVFGFQVHNPNPFSSRTSVLLHHSRLESDSFWEIACHVRW